jgi:hypothetical protein
VIWLEGLSSRVNSCLDVMRLAMFGFNLGYRAGVGYPWAWIRVIVN